MLAFGGFVILFVMTVSICSGSYLTAIMIESKSLPMVRIFTEQEVFD